MNELTRLHRVASLTNRPHFNEALLRGEKQNLCVKYWTSDK